MAEPFDIRSLVPSESRQDELTRILCDDTAEQAVRDRAVSDLCAEFDAYVRRVGDSWWRRFRRIDGEAGRNDITAAGRVGLMVAVRRWRPEPDKRFVHFASIWISESCKTEAVRLTQRACEIPRQVRQLVATYRALPTTGTERNALLKAAPMRCKTKRLIRYLGQAGCDRPVQIDCAPSDPRFEPIALTLAADEPTSSAIVERSEILDKVRQVLLTKCSPRQQLVYFLMHPNISIEADDIGAVFAKDGTRINVRAATVGTRLRRYQLIARLLGLSRERIRQIYGDVLTRLRSSCQ